MVQSLRFKLGLRQLIVRIGESDVPYKMPVGSNKDYTSMWFANRIEQFFKELDYEQK